MSLSQLTVAVAAASVTSRSLAACPLSRAARYLTQEGKAAGSASVFYICSSQFVEEKETLRVIYLRTISAVRGGNRQKHLEQ